MNNLSIHARLPLWKLFSYLLIDCPHSILDIIHDVRLEVWQFWKSSNLRYSKVFQNEFLYWKYYKTFQKQPREMFYKKVVLTNFAKFTGKHLSHSFFFNKVAGLSPATLFKKRLRHRCFPMNFAKFLRTPFLQNISGRLLLIFPVFQNNCFRNFCECS